jgi:hypothetical protein
VAFGPADEGRQRVVQLACHLGGGVLHLRRHGRVDGPDQQAVALQVAQGEREHAPADALHHALELGEPDRTGDGGEQDRDAPLAAHVIKDLADRARLGQQIRGARVRAGDLEGYIGVPL